VTVTSIKPIGAGRGGGSKGILETDDTMVWRIVSDDPSENSQTIGQQLVGSQLPTLYQQHPNYPIMSVKEVRFTPGESELIWIGTVKYDSQPITKEQKDRENYENPLDRPVKYWGESVIFQRARMKDRDGKAVVNTAGDMISGGIMEDDVRWVFHFEKNLPTTLPSWIFFYGNALNADDVVLYGLEWPAGTLKLTGVRLSEINTQNGIDYIVVSFELHYDPDGWVHEELNYGTRQIVDGKKGPILDDYGNAYKIPQPLDSDGKFAPPPADPYYVEFNVFTPQQFNGVLPLPTE
jgi:hypothetical protein